MERVREIQDCVPQLTPSLPQPVKFQGWILHAYTLANSIFNDPITNLLSVLCILTEIFSRARAKGGHFYWSLSEWRCGKYGSERVKKCLPLLRGVCEQSWTTVRSPASAARISTRFRRYSKPLLCPYVNKSFKSVACRLVYYIQYRRFRLYSKPRGYRYYAPMWISI